MLKYLEYLDLQKQVKQKLRNPAQFDCLGGTL